MKKRLMLFLKKHECFTLFLSDLTTTHYSKSSVDWYIANDVNFVPKELNPPNVSELGPIERYWALVKQKLRRDREEVKTLDEFKSR